LLEHNLVTQKRQTLRQLRREGEIFDLIESRLATPILDNLIVKVSIQEQISAWTDIVFQYTGSIGLKIRRNRLNLD